MSDRPSKIVVEARTRLKRAEHEHIAATNRVRCQQAVVDQLIRAGRPSEAADTLLTQFQQLAGRAEVDLAKARVALDEINTLPPWKLFR